MTSTGQTRRDSLGKESLWLLKLSSRRAIKVEESHNCESRTLHRSLSNQKTVRVVEETDLKVGG